MLARPVARWIVSQGLRDSLLVSSRLLLPALHSGWTHVRLPLADCGLCARGQADSLAPHSRSLWGALPTKAALCVLGLAVQLLRVLEAHPALLAALARVRLHQPLPKGLTDGLFVALQLE